MACFRGHTDDPHDNGGETTALLVVWPALMMAILMMVVHAFIVINAQTEAEVAASEALRAAWQVANSSDFLTDPDNPPNQYDQDRTHPQVLEMAEAARDAVARTAATSGGWRWWSPGVAEVQSDWCHPPGDASEVPGERRPVPGETGWVRVVVSGEVFGPVAALWPDRWDRVYAVAQGPAILVPPRSPGSSLAVPAQLPVC